MDRRLRPASVIGIALVGASLAPTAEGRGGENAFVALAYPGRALPIDALSSAIALADVDGDGKLDLGSGHASSAGSGAGRLDVRHGDGFGGFGDATSLSVGPSILSLAPVDLDADGDVDVVADSTGATIAVYETVGDVLVFRGAFAAGGSEIVAIEGLPQNVFGDADLAATDAAGRQLLIDVRATGLDIVVASGGFGGSVCVCTFTMPGTLTAMAAIPPAERRPTRRA